MKIGIMGGTYNPPHIGHIHAAQAAQLELGLDRIVLVPASIPPHKTLPAQTPDAAQRLKMTEIAARAIGAEVSDIELQRDGVSYTADTVAWFAEQNPGASLFFIVGTDMFFTIQDWYQPERIFRAAAIAVAARGAGEVERISQHAGELTRMGAQVAILSAAPVTVSSTTLRDRITEPEMRRFLPSGVWDFIKQEHLYGV